MPPARHSESPSFSLAWFSLVVLLLLVRDAHAVGVTFTTPAAGAAWPPGPISVRWTDAGGSPDMAALDTYELQLIVGGNDPMTSHAIATIGTPGNKVSTGQVQGTIPADLAQSVENGFYFRMTSNTTDGNTVINYSNRFTLINMKGTTESVYLDGANAAVGSSNVPAAQYIVSAQPANALTPGPMVITIATSFPTPTPTLIDFSTSITGSTGIATATAIDTNTLTTGPLVIAPAPVLPTATATAADSIVASDDSDGPGLGAMIGIILGAFLALVGVVSLFVWAFILYRHRKRRKEQRKMQENDNKPVVSEFDKAELPARNSLASSPQSAYPTELDPTDAKYELEGDEKAAEAARASIYELDSGWNGWEAMSGNKSKGYDPTTVV